MASDQYAPIVGGALKLKGSAPCGIQKKKKTKKNTKASSSSSGAAKMTTSTSTVQQALTDQDARKPVEREGEGKERRTKKERGREKERRRESDSERSLEESDGNGKTPAERAHEEMRRKRLHDRLAKEGLKTHKQRVEELNKYLSNLSEHHDMPRIGPG